MAQTAYFARFTPTTVESRRTQRGHAQLRARGVIDNRNGSVVRSVIAYGRLHDEIAPHMEAGRPMLLKGYYERVQNDDGSQGGEFFKPFAVIRIYDRPDTQMQVAPANDTERSVTGHDRRTHTRKITDRKTGEIRYVTVRGSKINGGRKN